MTKETELLPCPFCDGKAEMIKPTDTERWAQVNCTACGCRGTEYPAEITKAIAAWNRRALSPPEPTEGQLDPRVAALLADIRAIELAVDGLNTKGFQQKPETQAALDRIKARCRGAARAMPLQDHADGWGNLTTEEGVDRLKKVRSWLVDTYSCEGFWSHTGPMTLCEALDAFIAEPFPARAMVAEEREVKS